MADNTTLNAGTGGDVIASDDIGGVKHQQVKVEWGVDGTATPVSAANPMPVVQTGTHAVNATLGAETTKVIGTVNIASAQTLATVTTVGAVTAISNALPAGTNAIGTVTAVGAAAEDAAASGNPVLAGGRYDSSPRTLETGDVGALALNASGHALVEISAGAGSGGTSIADGASFTRNTTSVTLAAAAVETSAPTLTNGDAAALSLTTGGALRTAVVSGGITGAVVDSVAGGTDEGVLAVAVRDDALATLTPVDGDYTQLRTNARGAQWVALDSTAAQTVTLAAETTKVIGTVNVASAQTLATVTTVGTVTSITNQGQGADDSAFTVGTTRVMVSGHLADETATDSVDEGDMGASRMTLDRKQVVAQYAHTAGGWTPSYTVSAGSTNATSTKASAGQLGYVVATNVNAAVRYLKFYNKASAPTVGTDTPVLVLPLPGNTAGAGIAINFGPGIEFTTGIAWAMTTEATTAGTTGVSASEHVISFGYK